MPDFLAHLRANSARFADVLATCDPSAPVPTCPGWTAADLLWHLGEVQSFWGTIVRDRVDDPDDLSEPDRPDSYPGLLAFFRRSSDLLVDALATTADDVAVWTWFADDHSTGFVRRRQAHEALIHRLDAELAAGAVTDFDRDLAHDGVAEVLEWMYSGIPEWGTRAADGPIGRVATTDTGGAWLVQLGTWSGTSPNTGNVYVDEGSLTILDGGEPAFEVSGTARDLDAWLWNRPTLGEITRTGDCAAFEQLIRSGVQ
jgi:uncharacterized protein (TIGR03083 family)